MSFFVGVLCFVDCEPMYVFRICVFLKTVLQKGGSCKGPFPPICPEAIAVGISLCLWGLLLTYTSVWSPDSTNCCCPRIHTWQRCGWSLISLRLVWLDFCGPKVRKKWQVLQEFEELKSYNQCVAISSLGQTCLNFQSRTRAAGSINMYQITKGPSHAKGLRRGEKGEMRWSYFSWKPSLTIFSLLTTSVLSRE